METASKTVIGVIYFETDYNLGQVTTFTHWNDECESVGPNFWIGFYSKHNETIGSRPDNNNKSKIMCKYVFNQKKQIWNIGYQ